MNIIKPCTRCETEFSSEVLEYNGRQIFAQDMCDTCLEKAIQSEEEKWEETVKANREKLFWEEIPPLYQGTDPSRLREDVLHAINTYTYNPTGLGIIGVSGAGKTRAAVMLLHRLHTQNRSVCFIKATEITLVARDRYSDEPTIKNLATGRIARFYKSDVILIDDIGKGRLTPTAEELLFDVIDRRNENMLPTLWTSNMNAKGLQQAFSEDRGDALIRRLREFTKVITTK
jgi:hypothetical protein